MGVVGKINGKVSGIYLNKRLRNKGCESRKKKVELWEI